MSRFRVPDSVMAAHLEGEAVLLNLDTKSYHRLNDTAAAVWQGIERGKAREEIVGDLCAAFEVDAATAGEEMDRLVADLLERRLVASAGEE